MFRLLKNSFSKFKSALTKTRGVLGDKLRGILGKKLSKETLEEIEQTLFEADLGATVSLEWIDKIKEFGRKNADATPDQILTHLEDVALDTLNVPPDHHPTPPESDDPLVILVVGVNGSGKTTSAAKLAKLYQNDGQKVLLAAADTFRAAAMDQLETWAKRLGLDIVKGLPGGDPSAVLHDALSKAKAKNYDVVIVDTAGRLESKTDLMNELAKMQRVCKKVVSSGPHDTLLTIDATTGQNAIDQAKIFHGFTPLTGIILTKLDGSAKGGIVLSIYREMGIPIRYVGLGEGSDDFAIFEPQSYVSALLSR